MLSRIILAFLSSLLINAAHAALDPALVQQLARGDADQKIAAIERLADIAGSAPLLRALADNALYADPRSGRVYLLTGEQASDAATGAALIPPPENGEEIPVNNRVRAALERALAGLQLQAPERATRLAAARALQNNASAALAPVLNRALAAEQDEEIRPVLQQALALAHLGSEQAAERLAAVKELAAHGDPALGGWLTPLTLPAVESDAAVRQAATLALQSLNRRQALGENLNRIFTGISLGSILLLAALGLAITYGVMGVINMAHGEFLMIGAYATYVAQSLFQRYAPGAVDWYVLAAVPLAFAAAALVGMALERTVIRRLYGRPLETLLATWGLSLALIQAARAMFGPQNVQVANPAWMSGGLTLLPGLMVPWNRLIIIGFALAVLLLVWVLMNRTRLGLLVRAVTQNRSMAACVGAPTARIDTAAFGLGAGIAGLGGVALAQIANVGPDMGQGYIVDSFMVVVLGGVGQLAGAAWAALGLGVATKLLEGVSGAVVAKILVLAFIIVFIQKRPQGLFALKGRAS